MFRVNAKRNGNHNKQNNDHINGYVVQLHQVFKTYESAAGRFTALKGIDLCIHPGEFVSIIGKSGSGKSTLINMITGIDRPTSGEVWVAGTALHTLSEEQIAIWRGRSIGIIFQFFQLLPTLTAIENLLLAMDYGQHYPMRERPERALQLLQQMGMAEYAHHLPKALSGGQQQRVAIARALANSPLLLVADEPTGNLDWKTANQVFSLFEALAKEGMTIVMVTHDNDLARRAFRTVALADGRIVGEYTNHTPQHLCKNIGNATHVPNVAIPPSASEAVR
ncbi:MAG: ABC transporter ATP-binding protein [Anaerolineae bacterium]|nr:ABC transporter ATP-binding protein [Anaerolineae bacterium]